MKFEKDGVIFVALNNIQADAFRKYGYVEIAEEEPVKTDEAEKTDAPKVKKSRKKTG